MFKNKRVNAAAKNSCTISLYLLLFISGLGVIAILQTNVEERVTIYTRGVKKKEKKEKSFSIRLKVNTILQ